MPRFWLCLGGTCKIGHLSRKGCSWLQFGTSATMGTWVEEYLDGVTCNVKCTQSYRKIARACYVANTSEYNQQRSKLVGD